MRTSTSLRSPRGGARAVFALLLLLLVILDGAGALRFLGETNTYAKYPKWNACINASITFEFRTRDPEGLLLYTDDNGRYDYLYLSLKDGAVRLWMNFVDEREDTVKIVLGSNLNDNRWHRVEIKRNRMETSLYVDRDQSSQVAFGSDFNFGNTLEQNNYVYLGGIAPGYFNNLKGLALPSTMFERRFRGEIRNLLYFNCTCIPVRASVLETQGTSNAYRESCEANNPCQKDCPCISTDSGQSGCDCNYKRECSTEGSGSYYLPMDVVDGNTLVNPSGLDSRVYGSPRLVPGVLRNALELDGRTQWARISGPGHRKECLGDLEKCPDGYYLGMWLQFKDVGANQGVYLSNGGHRNDSHGVALLYSRGSLQFVFKKKSGETWTVQDPNVLPGRWYHVAASWSQSRGLYLYVNGHQTAHARSPSMGLRTNEQGRYAEFVLGRGNDNVNVQRLGRVVVDDLHLKYKFLKPEEVRLMGPVVHYHFDMETLSGDTLKGSTMDGTVFGSPRQAPGKIGNGLSLSGRGQYVDLGNSEGTCLGDLDLCEHGFYVSFWVSFPRLDATERYLVSSPRGITVYQAGTRLHASARKGDKLWETYYPDLRTGHFYFVEVSWRRDTGLAIFVDDVRVAYQPNDAHRPADAPPYQSFFIGRANTPVSRDQYGLGVLDNMDIFTADRETLLSTGFIQRGRPIHQHFSMESVQGDRLQHDSVLVRLLGNPRLTSGKIGNALELVRDGQVADFGDHSNICFGNLDNCPHGALVSLWLKPERLTRNAYYLSSGHNGLTLMYRGRRLHVMAATSSRTWEITSDQLEEGKWYFLEVSWHPETGLKLFLNNQLAAETERSKAPREVQTPGFGLDRFYLGRGNVDMDTARYGLGVYDELEYWYADRDYLTAFGHLQRDTPQHYMIPFEEISRDRLVHPSLSISLTGNPTLVPGRVGNALSISRSGQAADLGEKPSECLGNIRLCAQGITISAYFRFLRFANNMVYLSTGANGIVMLYRDGSVQVSVAGRGQVTAPRLDQDRWYHIEISWQAERGLQLYVDGQLVDSSPRTYVSQAPRGFTGNFFLGRANPGDTQGAYVTGAFEVDEMEIWYGWRPDLLAFGHINREGLEHIMFSMDSSQGDVIDHVTYLVKMINGATLTQGKIGKAVLLQGRGDYVDLGEHPTRCLGNLELCRRGMTISVWLRPDELRDGDYFLSGPSYALYYENRQLHAYFHQGRQAWNVASAQFYPDEWQLVTLSWHPAKGLRMYINSQEVDRATAQPEMQADRPASSHVYVGKSLEERGSRSARVQVDELQYWYDDLDQLRAAGIFQVVPVPQRISFERFRDGYLVVGDRTIRGIGGVVLVQGITGQAIYLNGRGQYLDLGQNFTCGGDLDTCSQGTTIRLAMRPERLENGMYFLDSWPVRVFYRDGRVVARMQTSTRTWEVSAPGLLERTWNTVELSWHPVTGLTMYLNGQAVATQSTGTARRYPVQGDDWRTYIGRSLVERPGDRYANALLQNIEVWNTRREYLPGGPLIRPDPGITIPTVAPPRTTQYPGGNIGHEIGTSTGTTTIIRFDGRSYVRMDFNRLEPRYLLRAPTEDFAFWFITDKPEGIIWHHDSPERNMHISIKDGYLVFVNDGPRGKEEVYLRPRDGRKFDDFRWHYAHIHREGRRMTLSVDGRDSVSYTFPTDVQFLSRAEVSIGGTPNTYDKTDGLIRNNFEGGVARVIYITRTPTQVTEVNLIAQLSQGVIHGNPIITEGVLPVSPPRSTPPSISTPVTPIRVTVPAFVRPTPVTFRASDVYILLPPARFGRDSTVSFKFQTTKRNGLLLYQGSTGNDSRFVAVELYDGKLYLVYDFGAVTRRELLSDREVSDGQQHELEMTFFNQFLDAMLDGQARRVTLVGAESLQDFGLNGRLYIGGHNNLASLPWYLFSREGFQGCLEELTINRNNVDLHRYMQEQGAYGKITRSCQEMPRTCSLRRPCRYGVCRDTWDSYVCDCRHLGFTGRNCDQVSLVGVLDGNQFGQIHTDIKGTHVNDFSLRFKTPLRNALLFRTFNRYTNDYLVAYLENGSVKVKTNIGGEVKTVTVGNNLHDNQWHTLYIMRRANDLSAWVDDTAKQTVTLEGEGFQFDIERVYVGGLGEDLVTGESYNNYVGYLQNLILNNQGIFEQVHRNPGSSIIRFPLTDNVQLPPIIYNPVTITSRESYVRLNTLPVPPMMVLSMTFKTRETSGVLLFNGGDNREYIALELYGGFLSFSFNTSDNAPAVKLRSRRPLNDNEWHTVTVQRTTDGRQFVVDVDGLQTTLPAGSANSRLDLQGPLYIGGLPASMFDMDYVKNAIASRHGFRGCLASIELSGQVPDLRSLSGGDASILAGCNELHQPCKPGTCHNFATCVPSGNNYFCDCNMTSYVGTICTEEAVGFRFHDKNFDGLLVYEYPQLLQPDSMEDSIALGFMTYQKDGVLFRTDSSIITDFIEIRLKNGYLEAEYKTDAGVASQIIAYPQFQLNDGKYHVVRFLRNANNATLMLDDKKARTNSHLTKHDLFNKQAIIYVGGVKKGADIIDGFNGIIAGVYFNGLRVLDQASNRINTQWLGDVYVAPHPFSLDIEVLPPIIPTPPPVTTPAGGGDIVIPGGGTIPTEVGGGGIGISGNGGGGSIAVLPGGEAGTGVLVPLHKPPEPFVSAVAAPPAGGGPRAGAVLGTILGILALASGLMWAGYKCKPGWCTCLKPAAAGAPLSISPPRPASNLGAVTAAGGGAGGAAGAGAGAGGAGGAGAGAGAGGAKLAVNGSASAAGGGGSSTFNSYFASSASAGGGGGGGGDSYDSATLRATNTFTNKGTVIGTPKAARAHLGSTASQGGSSVGGYSAYQSSTMQRSAMAMGGGGGGVDMVGTPASMGSYNYEGSYSRSGSIGQGTADYDHAVGISGANYQSNTLGVGSNTLGGGGGGGSSHMSSTMASSYHYQVQTVRTVTGQQQMLGYSGSNFVVTPGAAGEEVRVDCCLMTADGRSVVTGSSLGPPQVWDMASGELLRIMKGDTAGSTNLHLACQDRLLVGAVNCDLDVNEYSSRKGVTNRMLQIWDFVTGKPLAMGQLESCSALCVMSDGDKVVFARTDKFGSSTDVIVWDLLGNQAMKTMRYDAPVGNNDYVSFLALSQNDRYVVAGFTNTFDNFAEFVVFDMTLTSYNISDPSFLRLDANPEVTAILPREEAVTGLRNGDLVVWSLRTGQPSRQLLAGGGVHAHSREVKAVTLSEDNKYLVSASADCTLKVWDMASERHLHTLTGHTDEVWCVAVSPDSEIVVSGSRDGFIRLWRLRNGTEICAFTAGVDVFYVRMSHDKGTIVALGDKYGARKLIMLQVVRTKVRRQVSA